MHPVSNSSLYWQGCYFPFLLRNAPFSSYPKRKEMNHTPNSLIVGADISPIQQYRYLILEDGQELC